MNQVSTLDRFRTDLDRVRRRADRQLSALFDRAIAEESGPSRYGLSELRGMALAGGKRIRPAFVHWAFVAGGGDPDDNRAIDAGSVLELLHVFALVHDDVMDESPTRRGLPTLQVTFADRHRALGMRGCPERYGENMAILLGDFAFLLCTELAAMLPRPAMRTFYRAATQLMHGQYLDLETTATGEFDGETAARTARLKTGSYTVEGPLLIGAALAPRGREIQSALEVYGRAVGQAFQLCDDLLDVFGEEAETGKPVGGDITHHKATRLLDIARTRAVGRDRELLNRLADQPVDLATMRSLLTRTGAVDELEYTIDALVTEAVEALYEAPMAASGRESLIDAAHFAGRRKA
ncbi:geranylgeranyl pyrophosphate synthase [Kutzneria sp. CA-103260]|nr:geranylgeranyl pyrophosphate synthase [Kutzneria sp. CA-103260]